MLLVLGFALLLHIVVRREDTGRDEILEGGDNERRDSRNAEQWT